MKLIKDKDVILIDITNKCIRSCSNCMRFCGYHTNPYFMNMETFKKSIDSLLPWKKQIAIMGGEPLLHPLFKDFMLYIKDNYPFVKQNTFCTYPIYDIEQYSLEKMPINNGKFRLFTSVPKEFYQNFELINDVFESLRCNDHMNHTKHFTILADYHDLGISSNDFNNDVDNCWVQNNCGASITPKGAFFCEVAGALDMLYDGPGGWDIKPYWWERDDYSDQQKWCKVCGARLSLPMSNDNDDFDYITESILRKLISKKLRIKKHKIITKKDYEMYEDIWESKKREQLNTISEIHISNDNKNIKPISIDIINDESLIHNYNDWVIIGKNINTCNKLKSILSNAVINQGYAYCYDDCYAINVLSQVMINNNINDNFLSLFDKNKIINVKNMQHKTYINYNVQNTKWKDVKNINNILTHLK